ncbi:hypothetical protein SAY86_013083 [Trapa natans]|uniref:Uncharacterized protein n=1 Tax=Trapa natans TaxID=22666 RepID=A0AAN7M0S5_TRANT|nr:hypothetical protein SAY86_013083 [Trapa natans]
MVVFRDSESACKGGGFESRRGRGPGYPPKRSKEEENLNKREQRNSLSRQWRHGGSLRTEIAAHHAEIPPHNRGKADSLQSVKIKRGKLRMNCCPCMKIDLSMIDEQQSMAKPEPSSNEFARAVS